MFPTMYFSRSLFLIILSFFVPATLSDPESIEFSNCSPIKYPCGDNLYEIYYPFRLEGSPYYCGHPEFDLTCEKNNTLLTTIDGKDYQVNSIDYSTRTLHLTDQNFANQACPTTFTNTSFNFTFFDYSSVDTNLTVYFNCSPGLGSVFSLHNFSCSEYQSFYKLSDELSPPLVDVQKFCSYAVLVPLNQTVVARLLMNGGNDFYGALKQGFGLQWKVGAGWCKKCMDSQGICGNDQRLASREACFCSNGTSTNGTCVPIVAVKNGGSSSKNLGIVIGSVVGAGFLLLVFLPLALYFLKHRKVSISIIKNINNTQRNIEVFLDEYASLAPKRYGYSDVKKITKAFREKLGQGGYGTVFKGTLSSGKLVAVKILNDSKDDGEEFINEVASIGRTSHVNVVNLLGFCSEGSKRALIYEFMCNGSLEKLIYPEKPKTILDWEKLYQIALGTARGLEYLHRGCNTRIVHFDIKPHNILLDQDFCSKISDFGLAKLCLKKDSLISIAGARGTIGYIAPEVFSRNFGIVSSKSDVYSYGMMVLEITGGRKNMCVGVENSSEKYFPHWIYEHLAQNGDLLTYGMAAESEETVRKMILVGLWCIQTMPQNRPSMSRVIEMLEGSINDLQVPPKPYLSSSPLGSLIGTSSIQDICWVDSNSVVHS